MQVGPTAPGGQGKGPIQSKFLGANAQVNEPSANEQEFLSANAQRQGTTGGLPFSKKKDTNKEKTRGQYIMNPSPKPSVNIKTFGCKLNHYDSLLLQKQLEGLNTPSGCQLFVLNTCAVTAKAGRDIRREAEKIKHTHPNSLIAVTGCGAQVETQLYSQSPAVDWVIGPTQKARLKEILQQGPPQPTRPKNKVFKGNVFRSSQVFKGFASPSLMGRTRAFLKIQDGCNSFCSFCIIPFARGTSQSLPLDFLSESVKKLEEENVKEVVLTGVHIGDYKDGDKNLEDLIAFLLKTSQIPRIRLSSLEPIEITDRLLSLFEEERMCPHFHISLQSASSSVLKAMKRSYRQADVESAFQRIHHRLPHAFVSMDVIAGFPTETKKDFQEGLRCLQNQPWTSAHVFPYSPREGTRSFAHYKNLPQREIQRRAKILRTLAEGRFIQQLKAQKGTQKKVLLFKKDNTQGLSRDYWRMVLPPSDHTGEHKVLVTDGDLLNGKLKAIYQPS